MSDEGWKTELARNFKWIALFVIVLLGAVFGKLDIRIFKTMGEQAVQIINSIKD